MLINSGLIKPHDVTIVALTNLHNKLFTINMKHRINNAPVWLKFNYYACACYILRIFKKEKINGENH